MALESDRHIREFLGSTLIVWHVDARVEPLEAPGVASIQRPDDRTRIEIERAPVGDPFRWYLRRVPVDTPGGSGRRVPARPCGSLVGVLGGLRRMLGIDTGVTVRVARDPR